MTIQALQSALQIPLQKCPMEEGRLMHSSQSGRYILKGDTIIGLNLYQRELTPEQWNIVIALPALEYLNVSESNIQTIHFKTPFLKKVDVSDCTALSEVVLEKADSLEVLDASDAALSRLKLPKQLPALHHLDISRNTGFSGKIKLKDCTHLEYLDASNCNGIQVVLEGDFPALTYAYFYQSNIQKLTMKGSFPQLKVLDLEGNALQRLPADLLLNEKQLETLYASGNTPKNIFSIFLEGERKNALSDAKQYFAEIRDFPSKKNRRIKMMVLGNQNVGKSTITCALGQKKERCICKKGHSTTHGIDIQKLKLGKVRVHAWDFGGQEIYRGTHRLFMGSPAVQLLVFDNVSEKNSSVADRQNTDLEDYNQEMAYWYHSSSSISPRSHFAVVQNKIRTDEGNPRHSAVQDLADAKGIQYLRVSAQQGDGIDHLKSTIERLAKQLPEYGTQMPVSWIAVRQFFIDNEKNPDYKTISKEFLFNLFEKHKVNPALFQLLFDYLLHSGFLYAHEKLGDKIIVNQEWALEAIYKVFKRESTDYQRRKKRHDAEFSVPELFQLFDEREAGNTTPPYSDEEKELFIEFMRSCGICFKLNTEGSEEENFALSDSFIFPEFLDKNAPFKVKKGWENREYVTLKKPLDFVDYPYFQRLITRFGRKTPIGNIWRNGLYMRTEEGEIDIRLNYSEKAICLRMEQGAVAKWLQPMLNDLHENKSWDFEKSDWLIAWNKNEAFQPIAPLLTRGADNALNLKQEFADKKASEISTEVVSASSITRVLVLAATPDTHDKIDFSGEFLYLSLINSKMEDSKQKIEFEPETDTSFEKMVDRIIRYKPHVVHFIGHGEADYLVFSNSVHSRKDDKRDIADLTETFKSLKDRVSNLELVYLNACLSSDQAQAISSAKLFACGVTKKIDSRTAREVAAKFYFDWKKGQKIPDALREAAQLLGGAKKHDFKLFHSNKALL